MFPLNYSNKTWIFTRAMWCKQTNLLFTVSVTHQTSVWASLTLTKCGENISCIF